MYDLLIAEDELWIRSALRKMAEQIGAPFTVAGEAQNGIEAAAFIERHVPAVVITDIMMPQLDGLELIKSVRQKALPVAFIIISGYDDFNYAQQAIKHGVYDYLLKPVVYVDLKESLFGLISKIEHDNGIKKYTYKIIDCIEKIVNMHPAEAAAAVHRLLDEVLNDDKLTQPDSKRLINIFYSRLAGLLAIEEGAASAEMLDFETQSRSYLSRRFSDLCGALPRTGDKHFQMKLIIKQACDHVENRYMDDLKVTDAAEASSLSVSRFSALFKQYAGDSYVNYLNMIRIHHAKKLLMKKEVKIYEVAEMTGFMSVPYFNRVFKNEAGVSPLEFRRSLGL